MMYLDHRLNWAPGTAGTLPFSALMSWFDMVMQGPDKYVFQTESKNVDDTEALIKSLNNIQKHGGNLTLANAVGHMS